MPGFKIRRFVHDDGGAISIIAALSLFALLAIAAIVIDAGSLYYARRNLQATNDAAALAAVQNPANAQAVASDVFARNGFSDETLTVTTGVYTADESLGVDARFVPGSSGVNAVRVSARRSQKNYLAQIFGFGHSTLAVVSTAARLPTVSFGAGTRLASLDNGLANAVLGQMFGSSISLSAVDYESLLSTNIDALTFLNNLATQASITGSYSQLAAGNVTTGQILAAAIATVDTSGESSGDSAAALIALKSLQAQIGSGAPVALSNIVDISSLSGRNIGDVGEVDGTGAQFNVMSLMSASARTVAAGQLINVGTSLSIPVTHSSVSVKLAIGAPFAQATDATVGVSIRTAQIRMAIVATIANLNLGVAGATSASIQVPIYLEAAYGQATVTALPCTVGGTLAEIAASSGAVTTQFGSVSDAQLADFTTPVTPAAAPLLGASLLGIPIQVDISGSATIASSGPTTLSFTQAQIDAATIQSAPSGSATPFNTLSGNLALSTSILGNVGLLGGALNGLLSTLTGNLNPIAANLVSQLDAPVEQLLTTLGIQLGIIDVRVFGASCRTPVLVG